MSDFFKKSIQTIFLFFVFVIYIVFLITLVIGQFFDLGANLMSYLIFLFYILYLSGSLLLFFAFWLVFSGKTRGDWRYGILVFLLFIILAYYHFLSITYQLLNTNTSILLILDEFILLYVLMSCSVYLSYSLQENPPPLFKFEVDKKRFQLLLTFLIVSLFCLYFYVNFKDFTAIDGVMAVDFSFKGFPYIALLKALFCSGGLALFFALWIIYSPLVSGSVYYYIYLAFMLAFIYLFQMFYVSQFIWIEDQLQYWLLQGIVLVLTYLACVISIIFSDKYSVRLNNYPINKELDESNHID